MLHLKFALNLEHLADEMIEAISKEWKDPFNAPVVIFPDPKLEQWFRLRWMKKKGVLANLNKSTIDRFLFDILVGEGVVTDKKGNTTRLCKLSADILMNVILAYLTSETDGIPNYRRIDDEVTRYLTNANDPKGGLDENHLFDFALKMASLFLEYETSRPSGFAKNANGDVDGILDHWKAGKLQPFFSNFNGRLAGREAWQQKLYSAIFHKQGDNESLLTRAFKEMSQKMHENRNYLTIPYLFEALENGKFNEDKLPHGSNGKALPVFIFGLSGMGQFYRVILQKYASEHDVYAFIQNPCMEFWEDAFTAPEKICRNWEVSKTGEWKSGTGDAAHIRDKMKIMETGNPESGDPTTDIEDISEYAGNGTQPAAQPAENDLLVNWGRSGRDNIKLWCQATNYDFDFNGIFDREGRAIELPQDSLLHKIQYAVAHRENNMDGLKSCVGDGSLDVTAAPTRIREIENLHTQVCKLLRKGARVEDILVVSPCLDDYRTAINMVFDQSEKMRIPFSIVDSPARSSLTENALASLFTVLDQKGISRPDFFALVRNPVVQAVRKITNEEVDAWQNWVSETNTFRPRDKQDDWDKVKNRLLMAQMTTYDVKFDGDTLRPFSDMACSDKASLCKFIDCIETLEDWVEFGKNKCSDLDLLVEHLDKWIALPYVPDALKSESVVYRRVADAIALLGWQNAAGQKDISMKIVEQALLTVAQGTEYSCGNIFVNGITFMKFAPNRTLPVKHLFFIGADAMSFPGAKQHNTLDLRKSCRPWPGDDSPVLKNRYAFLCQLMSTGEGFHLSYVNKDIKKDAELYPSSVVNDLRKFIAVEWKENEIKLDETRDVTELFTPKSLRNKEAYEWMRLSEEEHQEKIRKRRRERLGKLDKNKLKEYLVRIPERVGFYTLASFLKDPFQFRISLMLIDEDDEDVEKELFEPVYFDHLDTSIVLKKALAAELSGESEELENFKKDLKLKGKMPNGEFGVIQWQTIDAKKKLILDQMGGTPEAPGLVQDIQANWSYGQKIQDLQFARTDGSQWLLSGKLDWSNAKKIEDVTEIIEVSSTSSKNEKISFDKYMLPYIKALAVIAYKGTAKPELENTPQTIGVSIYSCDKEMSGPAKTSVIMTPADARKKIETIYTTAFGDEATKSMPFSKAVPADLIGELKEKNIFSYAEKLLDDSWKYFDKKSLFNPLTDVGFSPDNFASEWDEATDKMNRLIAIKKYAKPKEQNSSATRKKAETGKAATTKTAAKKTTVKKGKAKE